MKPKAGTKIKGAVRREQVVDAALRLIGRKGVKGLTTAALAKESDMSEANLYRHFKNKNDISGAAFTNVVGAMRRNLEKAFEGRTDPVQGLKTFFMLQIGLMEQNRGIPRFMFSEDLHNQKVLREKVLKNMYGIIGRLERLIQDGQTSGHVSAEIDPRTATLLFVATVQGLTFRWSLSGFSFPLVREGAKYWRHFERILAPEKAARKEVKK